MAQPRTTFLEKLVKPTVNHLGFELWGVEQTGTGRHRRLCIYIDAPNGISVADCETVSQQLGTLLAVEDGIAGTYDLEVSSPGLDRLLFKHDHYQRNVGECVDVRLHLPVNGTRHVRGTLQDCSEESISVMVDDELKIIPFSQVRRTRLVPVFE
ncbi:MAG: ribosome maturation factor RimP [Gammaproteobacteria bacterium]|nr:ribosome maturation factor RimP [Gammaproteobacteria bacterium]